MTGKGNALSNKKKRYENLVKQNESNLKQPETSKVNVKQAFKRAHNLKGPGIR